MINKDLDKVVKAFKERDNFLVTAHVNPEGDSIGSQLAVYLVLKKLGKNVVVVDHDPVPEGLRFLPEVDSFRVELPEGFKPENIVIVDCPSKERTGNVFKLMTKDMFVINIDHHESNGSFGNINWIEPKISSVGEMVFHIARGAEVEIDKSIGAAIYTAIVTDTGMFNYENTSAATHEVVAHLISKGVEPKKMHSDLFERKTIQEVRLLSKALSTLKVEEEGKLAYITLTKDMYLEAGLRSVPTDEFINFPRSIKGIEVAVFFKENPDYEGKVNVSFRATGDINVNILASRFGGGGHAKASGCLITCGLEEAREMVLSECRKVLRGD